MSKFTQVWCTGITNFVLCMCIYIDTHTYACIKSCTSKADIGRQITAARVQEPASSRTAELYQYATSYAK